MAKYKHLFFDLDDTLWACAENACDTFREMYHKHSYNNFFDSFDQFYAFYEERNLQLWEEYGRGEVTKEELNRQRFLHPLLQINMPEAEAAPIAQAFMADFFPAIVQKSKLMPHALEVLEALKARGYHLYILSNGFQEVQCHKMQSGGILHLFEKILLSDDIGILKPHREIFDYALAETGAKLEESLMTGDSWANDIAGARNYGMDQAYYNVSGKRDLPFRPTFEICDLRELTAFL